jgi:hypothetical protein
MAEFLSTRWIDELDAAAQQLEGLGALDGPLVVEQIVRDSPGGPAQSGEVRYQVQLEPGGARVVAGGDAVADLVLVTDYATARRLHVGATRAQDALAAGRLKIRGAPETLAQRGELLAALDAAFAPVRARTTFADDGESPPAGQ